MAPLPRLPPSQPRVIVIKPHQPPPHLLRALPLLLLLLLGLSSSVQAFLPTLGFPPPFLSRRPPRLASLRASAASVTTAADSIAQSRKLLTSDIPFQLYNTASRKKEPFKTEQPGKVSFYSCGPTIYDYAHIGNFRAFLTYDVLKRWLLYSGYSVEHICNLTDVDDKIIKRMARDNLSLPELTEKYAQVFFEDLKALNIVPASHYPRATEHIDDIVQMVQELMERGFAYESQGSIYFRVNRFPSYGKLAWLDFSGMEAGAGEGGGINDADEYVAEKGDAKDFALWKAYKEEDGPVFWETTLGKGRPGWHIECSAMARKFLGVTVDVHAGGVDLVFPHHENEVAQSEAANGGRQFCNCWVHNGFVNVENEKMSKSKGNFVTLKGSLKGGVELRAFRYLVVTSQYRSPLNFNKEGLEGAKKTVMRLDKLRKSLVEVVEGGGKEDEVGGGEGGAGMEEVVEKALKGFEAGMADDLNTPRAAAALFTLVKGAEKALKSTPSSLPSSEARQVLAALERMDAVLGIFYDPPAGEGGGGGEAEGGGPVVVTLADLPVEAQELVRRRGEAKERKEWGEADKCRDELKTRFGVVLKDVKGGEVQIVREG